MDITDKDKYLKNITGIMSLAVDTMKKKKQAISDNTIIIADLKEDVEKCTRVLDELNSERNLLYLGKEVRGYSLPQLKVWVSYFNGGIEELTSEELKEVDINILCYIYKIPNSIKEILQEDFKVNTLYDLSLLSIGDLIAIRLKTNSESYNNLNQALQSLLGISFNLEGAK